MPKILEAFVKLLRLRHTAQVVGIVTILSIASHGFSTHSLYAIISSLFLCIAIFFLDDAHDYKSDQIVHPQRPIPKGLITSRQAYVTGILSLLAGTFFASMLFSYQLILFTASTIVAVLVIFLNLQSVLRAFFNAFLIWTLFPFAAFPDLKIVLFGLIMALPHIGGSITKDFLHSHGDAIQKLKPPPKWSKYLAASTFFTMGFIVWIPLILHFITWFYILPMILTQVSCILLGARILKGHYERVYVYGAVGMCSTLIAFLLGGI